MKTNAQKARSPRVDQWRRKNAHSLFSRIITTWTAGSLGVLFLLFCILAAVSKTQAHAQTLTARKASFELVRMHRRMRSDQPEHDVRQNVYWRQAQRRGVAFNHDLQANASGCVH